MYVCAVVHVNVELGPPLGGSEAMYLLQTQPMFTFEITKAIDVVLPLSVKVLRSIHESLQCIDYKGNSCSLHVGDICTYIIEESYFLRKPVITPIEVTAYTPVRITSAYILFCSVGVLM